MLVMRTLFCICQYYDTNIPNNTINDPTTDATITATEVPYQNRRINSRKLPIYIFDNIMIYTTYHVQIVQLKFSVFLKKLTPPGAPSVGIGDATIKKILYIKLQYQYY